MRFFPSEKKKEGGKRNCFLERKKHLFDNPGLFLERQGLIAIASPGMDLFPPRFPVFQNPPPQENDTRHQL